MVPVGNGPPDARCAPHPPSDDGPSDGGPSFIRWRATVDGLLYWGLTPMFASQPAASRSARRMAGTGK
jgi:hypothetical protein